MRKSILDALFPKVRQEVMSAFFLNPDKWWYLSDLANYLKVSPSTLQRELASLSEVQLLESKKEGNRIYYKANIVIPGFEELKALLVKTTGVKDRLTQGFGDFLDELDFAFVYGSVARGEIKASSDIDVMIIGQIKMKEMSQTLKKMEKDLGREVNPTIFSRKEFIKRFRDEDGFVRTVFEDKKIFIKGSEVELAEMVR